MLNVQAHRRDVGNLGQLFNAKGLPFHLELVERFGGMVKVYGFFGVGSSPFLRFVRTICLLTDFLWSQDEQLYISDPRALQSILLKDQDAYEETAVFIELGPSSCSGDMLFILILLPSGRIR